MGAVWEPEEYIEYERHRATVCAQLDAAAFAAAWAEGRAMSLEDAVAFALAAEA